MSEENLPTKIDPIRFAEHAIRLQGVLLLKDMPRLSSSLSSHEGVVNVVFQFGVDEQGIRFLRGEFATQLTLQCQRCTKPFAYNIADEFLSGIVSTDAEAEKLPKGYDPLIVKDGILSLQTIIEDELIIGLPIVPVHPADDCPIKMPYVLDVEAEADKNNPFKVIELLRTKNHNSSK